MKNKIKNTIITKLKTVIDYKQGKLDSLDTDELTQIDESFSLKSLINIITVEIDELGELIDDEIQKQHIKF